MAAGHFELWFDFSCPYAYLAARSADRLGVAIDWRPMLLGGVFRGIYSTGLRPAPPAEPVGSLPHASLSRSDAGAGPMATISAAKAGHNLRDMHRWAEVLEVPFRMPAAHPMRTVQALRTLLALPHSAWPQAIAALFAAYWEHGQDITRAEVIADALARAGLAADEVQQAVTRADDDAIKDELRRRTDEAIELGVFGAPAWVVRNVRPEPILVWGQDRFAWLAAIAGGWDPEAGPPPGGPQPFARPAPASVATSEVPLDVYVDVASPFAYLALTQLPALAGGARVRLVPILLGALFRELGTANVPLFAMPPPKLRYVSREMARWARWWGVPFAPPTKFPQRTVTAQRLIVLTILDGLGADVALALATSLGRAMWAEQRDLEDPETLRALLVAHGLPADWVERTQEPAVKAALAANTEEARARGVFGVPSFVVADRYLFWGQDRLDLVARALAGWVPAAERDAPALPGPPPP